MIWIHAAIPFFMHHNLHLYHNCSHMISHLEIILINSRPIISSGSAFAILGAFQLHPHLTTKPKKLKTFMALYDLDIFGSSKANLNWSKLPDNIWLSEWFRDIPLCCTSTAHNSTKNITRHQFGVTFWISIIQAMQYIMSSSKDPSGLGWWSVCTLLSCSGHKLHIIFAYWPCQNLHSWLHIVYAQQQMHFDLIHCYICPQLAFLSDLAHTITEWTQQGEEVLLLVDLNGDIRQQEITTFATSCGLSKSILSRHPTIPPPATFKHGNCPGCSPIGRAWATPGVLIQGVMMCAVQHSPGDHHALIVDVHLLDTIGEPHFTILRPPARRLCCTIPGVSNW